MNPMMTTGMCYVCQCKQKARIMSDNAHRIARRIAAVRDQIERLGYDLDAIYSSAARLSMRQSPSLFRHHAHAMCGRCHEIDRCVQEANLYGDRVAEDLIRLHHLRCHLHEANGELGEREKQALHLLEFDLFNTLRGHYPTEARLFSR